MGYVKAKNVLPDDIIEIIQEYVDGEYLYIPRKHGNEKAWGEKKGTRSILKDRNRDIYLKYKKGIKARNLAEEYFLSENSIRRIVREMKKSS